MFSESSPLLISMGQMNAEEDKSAQASTRLPDLFTKEQRGDAVNLGDALTLAKFAHFLGAHGVSYRILSARDATFTDLRSGPSLNIAGFDNPWTMRLTNTLRFHFVQLDKSPRFGIEDRTHPNQMVWSIDSSKPYNSLTKDYAIVARFRAPATDRPTMIAAGIGENGTIAASELLTDPRYLDTLIRSLPSGWDSKNVEAVIATQVIDGRPGPPAVVATQVW